MANQNPKKKSQQRQVNNFAKYSALAIQMAVVIGLCAWLGSYLDFKYQMTTKWFTIVLSLFGVFAATYLTLKDFLKNK